MHETKQPHLQAIGVFDSGVGGLTVMQQITKALPKENIIYFGDTARLPYGGKSRETIIRYSIENTIFLMEQNIKVLVVACSTASSFAVEKLKTIFNIPVVGTIEPGAERAVQVTRNKRIAVLGTRATVGSGVYEKEILKRMPDAFVTSVACPLFVPLVEELFISHPATKMVIKEYLMSLRNKMIDTIVLGCTHYPLLRHLIEEELGPDVTVVDSALTCAEKVKSILTQQKMHAKEDNISDYRYFVTDDPEKFQALGREFLGMPLKEVRMKVEG
jgi:glutamate racemase